MLGQEDQSSVPRYRFELGSIPLYDPRKDGAAAGHQHVLG